MVRVIVFLIKLWLLALLAAPLVFAGMVGLAVMHRAGFW
jgi:hypothetical protein